MFVPYCKKTLRPLRPSALRLAFVLLLLLALPFAAFAATHNQKAAAPSSDEQAYDAESALLMDLDSGAMLVNQAPEAAVPPASLTKIMTLYVLFEALERGDISLLDQVTVSAKADRTGGSSMGALTNRSYPMWQIIKGIAVASGNDAAQAAAEHYPGGEAAFVAQMNQTAQNLGLKQTRFANAHGLHHPEQTTTAEDMLLLAADYLKRFPFALRLHAMPFAWQNDVKLRNRNRLLNQCKGVDGLKTGYVRASGYNVVVTAKRNGVRLVGVVLGAKSPARRAKTARAMLEKGFDQAGNHALRPPKPQQPPEGAAQTSATD